MNPYKTDGKLVNFTADDGLLLAGFLTQSPTKTDAVIIHIHGLGGSFAISRTMLEAYRRSVRSGFNLFTINTRGAGGVTAFRKTRNRIVTIGSFLENFEECVSDISGAISAARYLGYKRIILSGYSTGCQKAVYYLSETLDLSVEGLILLAPTDDYNSNKRSMGAKFESAVSVAKSMVANGKGDEMMPSESGVRFLSANRAISLGDLKSAEARIFDYESGSFEEFSKVRCPTLVIFGSREESRTMPVSLYMKKLRAKARGPFEHKIIPGANHSFKGAESQLSKTLTAWLKKEFPS